MLASHPPKALIFDLDGVLIDSEPLHRKTWALALREIGIPLADEEYHELQGRTGEWVVQWLKERRRKPLSPPESESLIQRKRDLFAELIGSELRPVPGVDAFLRAQKPRLPLGLVTSSRLKVVGQIMLVFNWRNLFDALIGAEHVSRPKPHPEPFEKIAARFKISPSECLVFEDSAVGIESARAAGAKVCGVATTLAPDALRKAGARWTIRDFRDAATLEKALAGRKSARLFGWLSGR